MPTQVNEVQLSCGCKRVYSPQPAVGDLVLCSRHRDSSCTVLTIAGGIWAARCQWSGCRYSRTFGADRQSAVGAAGRHADKHPGHTVEISRGGDLFMVLGVETESMF
jgi:hypothetical protein